MNCNYDHISPRHLIVLTLNNLSEKIFRLETRYSLTLDWDMRLVSGVTRRGDEGVFCKTFLLVFNIERFSFIFQHVFKC